MKQLVCEMCGSNSLVKTGEFYICESCGTKYTIEAAKKLMIEGTVAVQGTVQVDNSAFIEKYLANARRALDKEDWEEVEKYYNMVEQNAVNNMEAVFFSAYGKAMLSLVDTEYYKREQKFSVFMKSISVINEYYERTNEDKEAILRKMWAYIQKMEKTRFVYNMTVHYFLVGGRGWCENLLKQARSAFLIELKQIAEVNNEPYIQELIQEIESAKAVQLATVSRPVATRRPKAKDAEVRASAIVSMVFGCLSIPFALYLFGVIFAIIALIKGVKIRKEYKDTSSGKFSLVAIITSIVGCVLTVVMIFVGILAGLSSANGAM